MMNDRSHRGGNGAGTLMRLNFIESNPSSLESVMAMMTMLERERIVHAI